jgi:hypothetical protein
VNYRDGDKQSTRYLILVLQKMTEKQRWKNHVQFSNIM